MVLLLFPPICTYNNIIDDVLMMLEQAWELLVLDALKWNVHYLTSHDFLQMILCRMVSLDHKQRCVVQRHAQTFANVCIVGELSVAYNYLLFRNLATSNNTRSLDQWNQFLGKLLKTIRSQGKFLISQVP